MSPTQQLAIDLIARASVTPDDAGCQALLGKRLDRLGFKNTPLRFGDVDNFWAVYGDQAPLFVFAGHTDVVPTGEVDEWRFPPFEPTCDKGLLYGRGAADMKGSLAAMVTACERFLAKCPRTVGSIAFLITSDEEGPAVDGSVRVVDYLLENHVSVDYCLVGEPSSTKQLGDTIKNGRRGSLNGTLIIHGTQGHVAYPHLADNPIHKALQALDSLCKTHWDDGNDFFPPTSFQISNIQSGTGATNVIPMSLKALINFRYSTEQTAEGLQQQVEALLNDHQLSFTLDWNLSGEPFLTEPGALTAACAQAIQNTNGVVTQLSTSGGTSDGRFIAKTGCQIVELGPLNATIHQVDECVSLQDLDDLSVIYEQVLEALLS